ncbi:MAG: hypothetical protein U0359_00715 [Byssovorax sp.]
MILTTIVPGGDGKMFTVESQLEGYIIMFDKELRRRGDTRELLDLDDITLVQRGRTRFLHRGQEIDPTDRVFGVTRMSVCPARERKIATLHYALTEMGLPLLNRSFAASPELELNKTLMHALVAELDIPCVPSMPIEPYVEPEDVLAAAIDFGFTFPMILKPNRMSNGVGIMRSDEPWDFVEKVRLLQMVKEVDYLVQDFVPHTGDLRVYVTRDEILGHKHRGPRDKRDFRCGGGEYYQIQIPAQVQEWNLRIAKRCDADYLAIDWLETEAGFVFHEMCATFSSFIGVPEETHSRVAKAIIDLAHRKLAASSTRRRAKT